MKKLFLTLFLGLICLFSFGQTITLQFQAVDSLTHQSISIDSIKIENITQGCDTIISGENTNSITLVTNVGIPDHYKSYTDISNGKPNPFNGRTYVDINIPIPSNISLNLYNSSGILLSNTSNFLNQGNHRFEINSNYIGILFLKVFVENTSKTIKLINMSNGIGYSDIKYIENNTPIFKNLKYSGIGFNFYIGDSLQYTASSPGYYDEIINDSPTTNTIYTFYMTDTAKAPVVTTQAVTNVVQTTATGNGTVVSDGGAEVTERGVCWNTTGDPTLADNHANNGTGIGSYSVYINGLNPYTLYHVRAYAINRVGVSYGNDVSFLTQYSYCDGITVVNYQGKDYHTVEIGTQCWFKENLDVGIDISSSPSYNPQTDNNIIEKYSYNNVPSSSDTYGGLYQWNEAINYATNQSVPVQGLCPDGWHIPTDAEWSVLGNSQGGQNSAGGPLKEEGFDHWWSPNTGANNNTNFTALPGGKYEFVNGISSYDYTEMWQHGYFWTSTQTSMYQAKYKSLSYDNTIMSYTTEGSTSNGLSIRCIKGEAIDRANVSTYNQFNVITDTTAVCQGYLNSDGGSPVTEVGICYSTSPNPDINGNHISTETYSVGDPFEVTLTNLTQLTIYHIRAYAINAAGVDYGDDVTFTTIEHDPCGGLTTITYGGKTYNIKKIGTQCWFKENLDIGTQIQGNQNQTNNSTIEKYCYNNDPSKCNTYGGLYQWDELMNYSTVPGSKGICPDGWHIPTNSDFGLIVSYLNPDEGTKMKSTYGWYAGGNGTNSSDFTGLPGGNGVYPNTYYNETMSGGFYTSDQTSFNLNYNSNNYNLSGVVPASNSSSVRCVKNY